MSDAGERGSDSTTSVVLVAIALGIAGLLVGLLLGLVGFSLLFAVLPVEPTGAQTSAVTLAAQGLGLVTVAVLYLQHHDLPWSYVRIERPSVADVAWTLATTVGLFATLAALLAVIQQVGLTPTEHSVVDTAREEPEILLALIPLSVVVTGPTEELLYRGVIQTRLQEALDTTAAAVLVAALVFAVVHVPAYGLGASFGPELGATLAILFVLGTFLGAAYEYTDNLLVPAVAHGLYNAVVFGVLYVRITGGL